MQQSLVLEKVQWNFVSDKMHWNLVPNKMQQNLNEISFSAFVVPQRVNWAQICSPWSLETRLRIFFLIFDIDIAKPCWDWFTWQVNVTAFTILAMVVLWFSGSPVVTKTEGYKTWLHSFMLFSVPLNPIYSSVPPNQQWQKAPRSIIELPKSDTCPLSRSANCLAGEHFEDFETYRLLVRICDRVWKKGIWTQISGGYLVRPRYKNTDIIWNRSFDCSKFQVHISTYNCLDFN